MPFIIRNMAFDNMPIIGIGMLASPVLRLTVRDSWIGWNLETLHKKLCEEKYNPSEIIDLFYSVLFKHIDNTYYEDLPLNEKIINKPTIENIVALEKIVKISEKEKDNLIL